MNPICDITQILVVRLIPIVIGTEPDFGARTTFDKLPMTSVLFVENSPEIVSFMVYSG